MELFEEIRREYRFGAGTIRGVAKKLKTHRRMVRQALAERSRARRKARVIRDGHRASRGARSRANRAVSVDRAETDPAVLRQRISRIVEACTEHRLPAAGVSRGASRRQAVGRVPSAARN